LTSFVTAEQKLERPVVHRATSVLVMHVAILTEYLSASAATLVSHARCVATALQLLYRTTAKNQDFQTY
jgi:hypothetical protein